MTERERKRRVSFDGNFFINVPFRSTHFSTNIQGRIGTWKILFYFIVIFCVIVI